MSLSPKREAFAQAVANGSNATDAYRSAYPSSARWKSQAVWVNSSKLMADANVRLRINELRSQVAEKQLWTREDSVNGLKAILDAEDAKASDRVAAMRELNQMHGYKASDKLEVEHKGTVRLNIAFVTPKDD